MTGSGDDDRRRMCPGTFFFFFFQLFSLYCSLVDDRTQEVFFFFFSEEASFIARRSLEKSCTRPVQEIDFATVNVASWNTGLKRSNDVTTG